MLQQVDVRATLRSSFSFRNSSNRKKSRNPKNVVLSVIRKIFAKKVDINVEIVNESQDFVQHPVLCYTILQLIIVKNKTHILAIKLSKGVNSIVYVFPLSTTCSP